MKWFVLGAVGPDVIYFIMFFFLAIEKGILNIQLFADVFQLVMSGFEMESSSKSVNQLHDFILEMFNNPVVDMLRKTGHSLIIWGIVYGVVVWRKGLKLTWLHALLFGWVGHIITDLLTHVTDATPIFYPISDVVIKGPVSYWNPNYYGKEFQTINTILIIVATVYMVYDFIKYKRRNKK
ncbi:zinc dependent phospholipase C family protein (plasmid) [Alkalihalobacillus hwajinpoensis]|nr:zinc dependent phospholipase C family protein [Pseudalkalibacillus hwajinpoensis]